MFEESDSSSQAKVSFDPARDPSSFTFKSKVQDLGIPSLPLYEPDVETMQATFGMGWFYHPEALYGGTKGVIHTRVGYAGGASKDPGYQDLEDHTEAVNISYDPKIVTFQKLISLFWENHNPRIPTQQQYKSIIFYHDEEQKIIAQNSLLLAQQNTSTEIHTEIHPSKAYYVAENYHQKYILQQHPWLIVALQIQTGDEFIRNHVCAKLNGYLAGYSELQEFDMVAEQLGLSKKMIEYIGTQMKKSQNNMKQ